MTVSEAFEIIQDLRRLRDSLRNGMDVVAIVNNSEVSSKIARYNDEIERFESYVSNYELDDSYEVDSSLYTLKEKK
mgnify:CR=1 FL=1